MKFIQLIITLSFVFTLESCSTVEGMGRDLQTLGKVIEKSAEPAIKVDDKKPVEQPSGAIVTPIK
jgi:predicted small secreted protein